MDYDEVAVEYDRRYALRDFAGIREALLGVAVETRPLPARVLELGCGTGKWLSELAKEGFEVAGIDPSAEMLKRAEATVLGDLRLGQAEELPWGDKTFDLVICVNAIHHFRSAPAALAEAFRVLRPGGALTVIGLDPHAGEDSWYVYEFFPAALERDRARHAPRAERERWLTAAGFEAPRVFVAERIQGSASYEQALAQGILARTFTSQLTELTDAEYAAGLAALRASAEGDASFRLLTDLDLYATAAWRPAEPRA